MKEIDYYHEIENYLKGRMSREEREKFETKFEIDPGLKSDVDLHRDIFIATGEKDIIAFRKKLSSVYDQASPDTSSNRSFFSNKYLFFLILTLILAIAAVLILRNKPAAISDDKSLRPDSSQQKLETEPLESPELPAHQSEPGKQNFEPPPGTKKKIEPIALNFKTLALREYTPLGIQGIQKGTEASKNNIEKAWLIYAKRHIDNKLDLEKLDEIIALLDPPDSTNLFDCLKLRANAYFQVGKFEKAAQDFQNDIFTGTFYQYDAEWNLLLCRLALLPAGREEFDQQMEKILGKPTHTFYQEAVSLKEKLSEIERK